MSMSPRTDPGSIDQGTIENNALQIARILHLRGSMARLPGKAAAAVHRVLAGIAARPHARCYDQLTRIRDYNIEPRHQRHYLICLILLDKLWLIRPGSLAEQDVLSVYRESRAL